MMNDESRRILSDNLAAVRSRIDSALARSGRPADSVRLIAVTKYVDAEKVRALSLLGVNDFGENRLQTAEPKLQELGDAGFCWHWIGSLQTNKIRKIVGRFQVIHSIDRIPLIEALEDRLKGGGDSPPGSPSEPPLSVYLQVNVSGESSKSGFTPEEALRGGERLLEAGCFHWMGLMTMAPIVDHPDQARPTFAGLRETRDHLEQRLGVRLPHLSMGMSDDFEIAVEEGATDVRIGSLLFEGLA